MISFLKGKIRSVLYKIKFKKQEKEMDSFPGYTINPDYAMAENDIPDRFLAIIDSTAEVNPDNVNSNPEWSLVHAGTPSETFWTWRKGADNETSLLMKVVMDFEGADPNHLYQALQINHRVNWEAETPLI